MSMTHEELDRAARTLTDVEPPADLEARIKRRLDEVARPYRPAAVSWPIVAGLVTATVVLAAVLNVQESRGPEVQGSRGPEVRGSGGPGVQGPGVQGPEVQGPGSVVQRPASRARVVVPPSVRPAISDAEIAWMNRRIPALAAPDALTVDQIVFDPTRAAVDHSTHHDAARDLAGARRPGRGAAALTLQGDHMRRLVLAFLLTAGFGATSFAAQAAAPDPQTPPPTAQTPTAPPAQGGRGQTTSPAPQAPPRSPSLQGQALNSTNIRLDLTITDTFGGKAQTKTVTMTIMSGQTGMVRTQNVLGNRYQVRLNVDAQATAYSSGLISTRLTVNYLPGPEGDPSTERRDTPGQLEESVVVVLTDGKTLVLTESADPVTDRKVTLSATATILK